MVTKWMGDHYVLGFVPALRLRVLSYSVQTLLLVYNTPMCMHVYTCKKDHMYVYTYYRSCRTCESSLDNGNIKITQHELKPRC